jgi:hypothetical protein
MKIVVHIERLILDGPVSGGLEIELVQAALAAELARLLGAGGISPELTRGAALATLRADMIAAAPQPEALGTRIAGALYAGLGDAARPPAGQEQP